MNERVCFLIYPGSRRRRLLLPAARTSPGQGEEFAVLRIWPMDLVIAPLTSTPRQGRGLIKGKITKRSQELSCLQQMVVGQLTITDCSTASRGAAHPDTIGSNGVPANRIV